MFRFINEYMRKLFKIIFFNSLITSDDDHYTQENIKKDTNPESHGSK